MNKLISAFLSGLLFFTTACTGKYLSKEDYSASAQSMREGNPAIALEHFPSGESNSFIVAMEKTYLNLLSGNYDVSLLFKYRKHIDNQIKYQISREAKSFFYLHTPEGYYASEHEIIMMHILLSWGFSGQKKYEEAEVEARKAATLFSKELNDKGKFDDPLIRIMLAYVWTLCGNWDEARVDFRAAYKLNKTLVWSKKLAELDKQPENLFFIFGGPGVEPEWDKTSNGEVITGMKGLSFESQSKRSELMIYDAYRKNIPLFISPDSSAWYKRHIERNNAIQEFVQDLHYGKTVTTQGTLSTIQVLGAVSVGLLVITSGLAAGVGIIYLGAIAESGEMMAVGCIPIISGYKIGKGIMVDGYNDASENYNKNVDPSNYYRYVRFLPEYLWIGWTNNKINYPIQIKKNNEIIKKVNSEVILTEDKKAITNLYYADVDLKYSDSFNKNDSKPSVNLLHKAIANNNNQRLSYLLQKGELKERRDKNGFTPLQLAFNLKKIDAFRILLKNGADPYVEYEDGETLLVKSARNMDNIYLSALIENGIDCNSYDINGKTPLICAVEDFSESSVKTLLSSGALVNLSSKKDKKTPLHFAVIRNNKAIVLQLLEYNADVSLKDSQNMTPADYANKFGFEEIYDLIQNVNKKSR
ncbi:MAG TPA: ankyrin repeat domain-containing protein [Spirochaetota bacterium]|nr:ankyrin repeat domain-containing protein [Spirochaetota bacterium]HOH37005.1 ankyrin repeat domain-containing protein [Spirochaetota bacterium]HPY04014.1 ankyrin repeat domain-containing protein [Spirochaetota bacterium]HQA51586.1 ankyrin repeat domain-containing protein [Spirochaetota bacterium]